MQTDLAALPPQVETIAELRELYRAAEARAARMRLLFTASRDLANAQADTLAPVLQRCAQRLAYSLGRTSAQVRIGSGGGAIPIRAPGPDERIVAGIIIDALSGAEQIADAEDRETFGMYLELMGAAVDRIAREQERAHLLEVLQEREQRLELLVGSVFSAQEEERRRVSRELHDGVAQTATALFRMLDGRALDAGAEASTAERARLAAIAREVVTELRGVIGGLRPTLLDDLGLHAALNALADGLETDGYTVERKIAGRAERLPPIIETALFRVAQEAITNIRKHAGGPCPVTLELDTGKASGQRLLRITDRGRGAADMFAAAQVPSGDHIGITVMHERMTAVGGRLEWETLPRGGVNVTAYLPGAA